MTHHRTTAFLIPMLALSMALAIPASLRAQDRDDQRSSGLTGTLQIRLDRAPRWTPVDGTRVRVIRQDERPDYDMFQYDNRYYVYDNSRWYTSNQWRGSFTYVDIRSVPSELSQVPREYWRDYPSEWQDRNERDSYGSGWRDRNDRDSYGSDWRNRNDRDSDRRSLEISFNRRPRWTVVPGTRVWQIRQGQRPDYDMFRYANSYYVYDDERWYTSHRWNGTFTFVEDRFVPREISMVPRNQWRNYPQGWANQHGDWRSRNRGPYRR